ncbi:hypothetical protein [Burkholderia dolosa]|uniref:hypothetical protein n=1 Tax=Burkholderia dolosa TaxID=152500 RepID=UPI001591A0D6|nr:hypothetical protein [Burkholderia dolosa]MBR8458356.1 hypothetical protein [Burkholderia dolosa]MBY4752309.1 hypothetical protein [Burkholderia dolosa]MBY4834215.1 hypothetical protein [Burkholderia dolosa]MDN7422676.1 hypothetical protein [Burkholderia dolosa]
MEYEIEIDSREKKSAKKRMRFIGLKGFRRAAYRFRIERFVGCMPRRAAARGIFYGSSRQKAVVIAISAGPFTLVPARYFTQKHPQIFPNFL